jgi:hypothetical protein
MDFSAIRLNFMRILNILQEERLLGRNGNITKDPVRYIQDKVPDLAS